jgi:excisionase family DNA binding protein
MLPYLRSRIRQLDQWLAPPAGEVDYQQLADDCRALVAEVEQRALQAGIPAAVAACQRPCHSPQLARQILAECVAACPTTTELLTVRQAAESYGIGERTLYRLVERGEVMHTRVGKSIRFRPADLARYLARPTEAESSESLFG